MADSEEIEDYKLPTLCTYLEEALQGKHGVYLKALLEYRKIREQAEERDRIFAINCIMEKCHEGMDD